MNLAGLPVLIIVQWWISHELARSARGRFTGWASGYGVAAAYLFGVAAVMSYVFSFSEVMSRLYLSGPVTTWIGAAGIAYSMVATACVGIYLAMKAIRKQLNADVDPGRRRVLNLAGSLAMAAPFAVVGYGSLVQRTNFRVREMDIALPGLPTDLENIRILHLSDIHLSPFLSESELERVIDASLELRPHLAVVTGDLISTQGDPLDACIRQLARIKTDAGLLACMGNHERYAEAEDYAETAGTAQGLLFLRESARTLRFGKAVLNIAGVDYQSLAGRQAYLRGAQRLIVPGACNILLSHNPDVFPVAVKQGWNLTLSGHTHGGQVTVEILDKALNPARFITPYVYGLYRREKSAAYVTRGIGTIGIPARIGAPPEISVLRLRKA